MKFVQPAPPLPPKLPPKAQLEPADVRQLTQDQSLQNVLVSGVNATGIIAKNLSLDEALLEKVVLAEAHLEKLGTLDTELKACDFSAARCAESSLVRTRIVGGRMTGVDFSRSSLKDVIFEGCKLNMANFRFAKLTRVRFVDCGLDEADFQMAELLNVTFESCQLAKTEFGQCKVKNVDLRGTELADIRGWDSLRGAAISSEQLMAVAPQLARELGLLIQD